MDSSWSKKLTGNIMNYFRQRNATVEQNPPVLYGMEYGCGTRTVRMAAEALNIPLECRNIDDLSTYECGAPHDSPCPLLHAMVNPQRLTPKLIDRGIVFYDSHAISVYLINRYGPSDPSIYPADLVQRAHIDRLLHFDSSTLFPRLHAELHAILHGGRMQCSKIGRDEILEAYSLTNKYLMPRQHDSDDDGRTIGLESTRFLTGNKLTLADIACISTISQMDCLVPIPNFRAFSQLRPWMQRVRDHLECYVNRNVEALEDFRQMLTRTMEVNRAEEKERTMAQLSEEQRQKMEALRALKAPVRMRLRRQYPEMVREISEDNEEEEVE